MTDSLLETFDTKPEALDALSGYEMVLANHGLARDFEVYPHTVNVSAGGNRIMRNWGLFVGPVDRHNPPNLVTLHRKCRGVSTISRLFASSG